MLSEKDLILNQVRKAMPREYPMNTETRRVFGSIPERLHEEITEMAQLENVSTATLLAAMRQYWVVGDEKQG